MSAAGSAGASDTLGSAGGGLAGTASGGSAGSSQATGGQGGGQQDSDPEAGGTAGSSAGTAACDNPEWLFCEDFESYEPGTVPDGTFQEGMTNNGDGAKIEVSLERKTSGLQSVLFHVGQNSGRQLLHSEAPFAVPASVFYGRMMVYIDDVPVNAHWEIVLAGGEAGEPSYHWGGQFGETLANYHPGDCYKHIQTPVMPSGKWVCYEWKFDSPAKEMHLWIDDLEGSGMNHGSLIKTGEGGPCGEWTGPEAFTRLAIGYAHYQASENPLGATAWIDDVVIDDERVGCPALPVGP